MTDLFNGCYTGRRVLLTGHTGFKGSWLAFWLRRLGAEVVGYALPPQTDPNHWDLLRLADVESNLGDIRDMDSLLRAFRRHPPEIVFHLAAQPLVRRSYREPVETFSTNVLGTLNVFEAARAVGSVRALVCVTSDKVYENQESAGGYVESDRLGGSDPYSASKACTEILAACYRKSYFANSADSPQIRMATVRAGNVIGGGDWSEDRLIPDAVRAAGSGGRLGIRNPSSVRPWQHVLEPLAAYLAVGRELLHGNEAAASAWNFGPGQEGSVAVRDVIGCFQQAWPALRADVTREANPPPETETLRLDSRRAIDQLHWRPLWDWQTAVTRSAHWYRRYCEQRTIATDEDLDAYIAAAGQAEVAWACSHERQIAGRD